MLSNYVRFTDLLEHYNYPHIIILQVGGNDISKHHFEESAFLDSLDNITSNCRSFGCTVIVMGISGKGSDQGIVQSLITKLDE